MKKFILVLIATLICSFLFAYDDQVILSSYVMYDEDDIPSFSLIGLDISGAQLSTNALNRLNQNISKENIEVEFSIVQVNMSRFIGTIYLDIYATPFSNGSVETKAPEIINVNLTEGVVNSSYANKRFVLSYNSYKNIDSFNVGSFKIRWEADTTLPSDFYETDITLSCTIY